MEQEVVVETLRGDKIKIEDDGVMKLTPRGKMLFACPPSAQQLADVVHNAEHLFSMHPAPWSFREFCGDGYVVDANNKEIFGGEACEGYVGKEDENIVALVDVINSLWVYMKGKK